MYQGTYLFTGIKEGTAIQTSLSGSQVEFLLAYEGHHFDRDWNIVETRSWAPNDPRWESMGIRYSGILDHLMQRAFGLYWIGLPPRKVMEFDFKWTEPKLVGAKRKDGHAKADSELDLREGKTRSFYAKQFAYTFTMDNVETSVGIKVDVRFTVFVRGTNPHTALIKNDSWFLTLDTILRARVKDYIGSKSFIDLLSESGSGMASLKNDEQLKRLLEMLGLKAAPGGGIVKDFSEFIREMTREVDGKVQSLPESLGVAIDSAKIQDLDLSPDETVLTAIQEIAAKNAKTVSEAKAYSDSVRQKAEADKAAAVLVSQGQAEAIRNVGAARAAAITAETGALRDRFDIDKQYIEAGGGAVVVERARQDGFVQMAERLAEAPHLTSVVFPQTAGVAPVVPVGNA